MTQEDFLVISAEAILRSKSGRSLTKVNIPITKENIEEFTPTNQTINEAIRCFEELGFTVARSVITLSILGKPEQFERVFKVKLTLKKDKPTGSIIVHPEEELIIPDSLTGLVEKVVFPEPPELFP